MEAGDEVRRLLPSGKEEVFIIRDAIYSDGLGPIPPHYSLKVFRKGSFARHTGGHYINVSGSNARVNLHSTDNSTNTVSTASIFAQVASALEQGVEDEAERATLLEALKAIEAKPLPEDMTPPQRSRMAAAAAEVVAAYRRAGSPGLLKHIHSTQHFVHSCAVNAALEEAQPEGEGQ